MIEATRNGEIDAFVDDDVVMLPVAEQDEDLEEAFTIKTKTVGLSGFPRATTSSGKRLIVASKRRFRTEA